MESGLGFHRQSIMTELAHIMVSDISKERWWKRLYLSIKDCYATGWFAPNRSFLTIKAFWVPLLIILSVFVFLCWKVSVDEELFLGGEATLTELYQWFKIPLWWLALIIPLMGLLNANHKSEQTRAQMELTKSQNNFANYYKHAEEFSKHCKVLEEQYKKHALNISARKLHSVLYPNGPTKEIEVNTNFISNLEVRLRALNIMLHTVLGEKSQNNESLFSTVSAFGPCFKLIFAELNRIMDSTGEPFLKLADEDNFARWGLADTDVGYVNNTYFFYFVMQRVIEFDPNIENILHAPLLEFMNNIIELQKLGIRLAYIDLL